MARIALEFVPPNVEDGREKAIEEARKVNELSAKFDMEGMIDHIMIPGMIEEESDRPVEMKPKLDPLDTWKAIAPELPGATGMCTQVTAFLNEKQLEQRFNDLLGAGIKGIIFVGVPRTMADGEGSGVPPTDALANFKDQVSDRGAILIPTREGEDGRFNFKCNQGATFGMTQLLYSDAIVNFLKEFGKNHEHRPEVLLSFGFVPKAEKRIKLIDWLIQDPGNKVVEEEQAFVAKLSEMELKEKQKHLLELYKRVVDGVGEFDYPMSVHLEAPFGFTKPAFETFSLMLDYWSPEKQVRKVGADS
jgi:hypothetical protein